MDNLYRTIFTAIIFTAFRFEPLFTIFPHSIWRAIYLCISLLYLFLNRNVLDMLFCWKKKYSHFFLAIVIYWLLIGWSLFIICVRDGEFSYLGYLIVDLWLQTIKYCFLVVFVYNIFHPKDLISSFLKFFILSQVINVSITFLFLIYPEIREWYLSLIFLTKTNETLVERLMYISRVGLRGFSGFTETIECSLGILFGLYLVSKEEKIGYVGIFILLIGNFFYGRSGLIFSMFSILIYGFIRLKRGALVNLVLFISVPAILLYLFSMFSDLNWHFARTFNWAITPFVSLYSSLENGDFSLGSSADGMFTRMYFMPSDDFTVLMGDGRYLNSDQSFYMHTDVGFMRHMLFYGIIGEFLLYGCFSMIICSLSSLLRRDESGKMLAYSIFLLVVFFEMKGNPVAWISGIVIALALCAKLSSDTLSSLTTVVKK